MDIALKDLLSPAAGLIAAIGAVLGVFFTLRTNSRNQDKKQAFETYDAYLEKCYAEPKLANGFIEIPDYNPNYNQAPVEFLKYEWLVSRLLLAGERILEITQNDVEWRTAIKSQTEAHKKYLSSEFFRGELGMYSPEIQEIIHEVVAAEEPSSEPVRVATE
jgi:hypothetical protein